MQLFIFGNTCQRLFLRHNLCGRLITLIKGNSWKKHCRSLRNIHAGYIWVHITQHMMLLWYVVRGFRDSYFSTSIGQSLSDFRPIPNTNVGKFVKHHTLLDCEKHWCWLRLLRVGQHMWLMQHKMHTVHQCWIF